MPRAGSLAPSSPLEFANPTQPRLRNYLAQRENGTRSLPTTVGGISQFPRNCDALDGLHREMTQTQPRAAALAAHLAAPTLKIGAGILLFEGGRASIFREIRGQRFVFQPQGCA